MQNLLLYPIPTILMIVFGALIAGTLLISPNKVELFLRKRINYLLTAIGFLMILIPNLINLPGVLSTFNIGLNSKFSILLYIGGAFGLISVGTTRLTFTKNRILRSQGSDETSDLFWLIWGVGSALVAIVVMNFWFLAVYPQSSLEYQVYSSIGLTNPTQTTYSGVGLGGYEASGSLFTTGSQETYSLEATAAVSWFQAISYLFAVIYRDVFPVIVALYISIDIIAADGDLSDTLSDLLPGLISMFMWGFLLIYMGFVNPNILA